MRNIKSILNELSILGVLFLILSSTTLNAQASSLKGIAPTPTPKVDLPVKVEASTKIDSPTVRPEVSTSYSKGLDNSSASVSSGKTVQSSSVTMAQPSPSTTVAPKTIKQQATDLIPDNANKNRVTLRSENRQLEIDLAGKDHAGIQTPHTKESPRNHNAPERAQPAYNTSDAKSTTRSSTQEDIRTARRYLERQNK